MKPGATTRPSASKTSMPSTLRFSSLAAMRPSLMSRSRRASSDCDGSMTVPFLTRMEEGMLGRSAKLFVLFGLPAPLILDHRGQEVEKGDRADGAAERARQPALFRADDAYADDQKHNRTGDQDDPRFGLLKQQVQPWAAAEESFVFFKPEGQET